MEYRRFYDAQGKLQCVVNMEMISTAVPMGDGVTRISIDGQSLDVDSAQFEKAIARDEDARDVLSPASEDSSRRLTVFPSASRPR